MKITMTMSIDLPVEGTDLEMNIPLSPELLPALIAEAEHQRQNPQLALLQAAIRERAGL